MGVFIREGGKDKMKVLNFDYKEYNGNFKSINDYFMNL